MKGVNYKTTKYFSQDRIILLNKILQSEQYLLFY